MSDTHTRSDGDRHQTAPEPSVGPIATATPGVTGRPGLISAVTVGLLGIVTVVPFYLWDYHLQEKGRSAESIEMSYMRMTNMHVFWAIPVIMATGIAALLWAWLSVALGLLDSGRMIRWLPLTRAQIDRLHRHISLLVIALIVAHAATTAFDAMGDNLLTVFVPFTQTWKQAAFAYQLGIFALYLAILLGPSYYLRRLITPARWRIMHRASLIVYILSVWHALILGSEPAYYSWIRPVMWLAQLPLLALLAHRLLRPAARARNPHTATVIRGNTVRRAFLTLDAAAAVAVIAIVTSGHSGFIAHV